MGLEIGPSCHEFGIKGYGNTDGGVFLLGISPGREETKIGRPMIGQSGQLTNSILEACGWDRERCYATNIVCYECSKPEFKEVMDCRPRLVEEVKDFKPKLVVLLGEQVGSLFFPTRKYGTVRGAIDYYEPWGVHVLPTYHPAALLYGSSELVTRAIVRDFLKIREFFDKPPRPEVNFSCVTDVDTANFVMASLDKSKVWYMDFETRLDKEDDAVTAGENGVVCFSISDGEHTYWFPGPLVTQITWRKDIRWGFQNGMFDTVELQEATGVLLDIAEDTMLMSYCLDERGGVHGLKHSSREYEAAGFYEEYPVPKAKWSTKLADTEWIRTYNSKDTAYTARLAERQKPKVIADNMGGVYDMLIEAANIYRHMQATGIYISMTRFGTLLREYEPLRVQKDAALRATIAGLGGDPNINLGSTQQLAKFLYGTLRLPGGPSTAAPIIEALAEEHPFVHDLLDLRHLEKAINTYIVGAYDDIKKTGRIHPTPKLHGQVSGRVSYSPYAVNTLPRETGDNPYLSRIRWLFTAPDDDYVVLMLDYRQAEIFTAWAYCKDPNMKADLDSGDFHTKSAVSVFGLPPEQISSDMRSASKKVTFGQFFGIGNEKLAKDMTNEARLRGINRVYTYENAADMQRGWRQRYVKYGQYINDVIKEAVDTGELVSLSGHKRRFPLILDVGPIRNQLMNIKIQTTAHACLMKSIIKGYWMCRDMGAYPFVDLHDAVAMYAKKSNALEVARRMADIMQQVQFEGMPSIPVEAKIGVSLGEVKEVKF